MKHTSSQCRVVTRSGYVTAVHATHADIQIVQESACASCHIRGVCAAGDTAPRIIEVADTAGLIAGTHVTLSMAERYGWLGVLFAFVLPLLIVTGTLFGAAPRLGSEEAAALLGMGALVPYYFLLYTARHYFARTVRFEAHPSTGGTALKEGML